MEETVMAKYTGSTPQVLILKGFKGKITKDSPPIKMTRQNLKELAAYSFVEIKSNKKKGRV